MTRLATIAPLFLLSGGTALLYQVAFSKRLATIFGATAYAISAVLAAFMAGLALGSYLGGRFGGRVRKPLAVYGAAELIVGAVCAATPLMFDGITDAYAAVVRWAPESLAFVSACRALIAGLVVVVPTVAMGVTLPLLARAVAPRAAGRAERLRSRRRLALLYGINTAGGAGGAVLSAYVVLPALGLSRCMYAAALINVTIGAAAIALARAAPAAAVATTVPPAGAKPAGAAGEQPGALAAGELRLLGMLAFLSGLLVFAAEVVDTHLLTLLIGNSAYAFGLMLAVFLTCLSLGAALAEPLDRRLGPAALSTGLLLAALSLLLTLPVWDRLPSAFLWAGKHVSSWAGRELVRAVVALLALLVPTVLMGLTFPLLLRRVAGRGGVAAQVGRLTAVNTVGSIAGSLACGYAVLPALGSEWTLRSIALAFAAAACATAFWQHRSARPADRLARRRSRRGWQLATGGLVLGVLLAVLLPRWDMKRMTNGANVYFDSQLHPDELLFIAEDVHGGLTSVARTGSLRILYTNGKFQGDDGYQLIAQRSFAHFPSLFVEHFGEALVIGLGTGTTLATVAAYPYRHIDVAEISPAIVQAARRYFAGPNRGILDSDRVQLHIQDGRNFLLLSDRRYDLITIELTSVWFAGAANLYSAEFYELCRQRLGPSGRLQQWLQLHHIHRREVAVVLRTLRQVFDHVALFVAGNQGIVVASASPLQASQQRLAALEQDAAIRQSLDQDGSLVELLDDLLLSGPELDRFVRDSEADGGPIVSTDENLYLEHATPKGNVLSYQKSLDDMIALLSGYRTAQPAQRHLLP